MRFSEVVKKWEDGWRGIALDCNLIEWDFTTDSFEMPNYYSAFSAITCTYEEWTIKEEKKEPINITINVTVDSEADVEKIIDELRKKVRNCGVCFS